jgi:uroporphyrin-III C-methyltransferase
VGYYCRRLAEDAVRRFVSAGVVYLVGAGPGAGDLITVRGLRVLRSADVVLHDALISPELLEEADPHAELVSVGKRGYCVGSTKQETINDALIRFAREGKAVCRLKCGDPCVFGRGGEEAEVLARAGIPFEIVPGVTSAVGACAAAGIPLTHRDAGQAVALVTGHHDPDSPDCTLDWAALARLPGVVFYMAVRHVAKIAARLGDCGLSADTPAAVIESGTLPAQRVLVGELAEIGRLAESAAITGPAVFVVGEVVRYRKFFAPGTAAVSAARASRAVMLSDHPHSTPRGATGGRDGRGPREQPAAGATA